MKTEKNGNWKIEWKILPDGKNRDWDEEGIFKGITRGTLVNWTFDKDSFFIDYILSFPLDAWNFTATLLWIESNISKKNHFYFWKI